MAFRYVEQARINPQKCIVFPQLGATHEKGYLDAGPFMGSNMNAYLSVHAIEELAKDRGYLTQEQHAELQATIDVQQDRISELEDELKLCNEELDAIHVLESREKFKARRRPGPKKQKRSDSVEDEI